MCTVGRHTHVKRSKSEQLKGDKREDPTGCSVMTEQKGCLRMVVPTNFFPSPFPSEMYIPKAQEGEPSMENVMAGHGAGLCLNHLPKIRNQNYCKEITGGLKEATWHS